MGDKPVQETPCEADSDGGTVHVTGPDDIEVALTPKAALQTAKNLEEAAIDAIVNDVKLT